MSPMQQLTKPEDLTPASGVISCLFDCVTVHIGPIRKLLCYPVGDSPGLFSALCSGTSENT